MPAAMLFAAIALGIFKVSHLFECEDLAKGGDGRGNIGENVPDRCASMPKESVCEMYRAQIYRMRGLQRNNRFVGMFVVFGQWSLFAGIATMTTLAVFLPFHVITPVPVA